MDTQKESPEHIQEFIKKSGSFIRKTGRSIAALPWERWIPRIAIALYIVLLVVIALFVVQYSYKAWLYPIRLSQYFDECSYIAMGKYFRTLSPIDLFKDYILQDKKIPEMYHEFESRMIYWPIILAGPLSQSEDRVYLHIFRAIFLAAGSLVFFLLGRKLAGISGGVVAAAFWVGTPLLNYWGHFLMTEAPSFVFIAMAWLLLLYSDKSRWAAIGGGMFLGLAAFTRFTTIVLILPAPFFILAAWLHPFRRRAFQFMGELGKTLGGFSLTTVPYLVFTALLFKNPLKPFQSARYAVGQSGIVDDPDYYVRNLWIEAGPIMRTGTMLAIAAPVIIAISLALLHLARSKKATDSKPELTTGDRTSINDKTSEQVNHDEIQKISIRLKQKLLSWKMGVTAFTKTPVVTTGVAFSRGVLYYAIIVVSLIITASIYLYGVSDITHKLPRYLTGALIPFIILVAIGFGAFEKLLTAITRFTWSRFVYNKESGIRKSKSGKRPLTAITIIVGLTLIAALPITHLTHDIWSQTMNRPFNTRYDIPEEIMKSIPSRMSALRVQPELLSWKESIEDRLQKVAVSKEYGIDDTTYYGRFPYKLITWMDENAKHDEVLYTDSQTMPPFTPAWTQVPCMFINKPWGHSIKSLERSGELPYKGYVLVNNDASSDYRTIKGKRYRRSISKEEISRHNQFKRIKRFGGYIIYYYNGGKPFPWKYGTKERIKQLYPADWKEPNYDGADEKTDESVSTASRLFYSLIQLFQYDFPDDGNNIE
jgi:hypothetical protein